MYYTQMAVFKWLSCNTEFPKDNAAYRLYLSKRLKEKKKIKTEWLFKFFHFFKKITRSWSIMMKPNRCWFGVTDILS